MRSRLEALVESRGFTVTGGGRAGMQVPFAHEGLAGAAAVMAEVYEAVEWSRHLLCRLLPHWKTAAVLQGVLKAAFGEASGCFATASDPTRDGGAHP